MPHKEVRNIWVIRKVDTGQYRNAANAGWTGQLDLAKQWDDPDLALTALTILTDTEPVGYYTIDNFKRVMP